MIARCLLALSLWSIALATSASAQSQPLVRDSSDPFFSNVEIPELRIWIEPRQMDRLLAAPREYVCGVLTENNATPYGPVGVKLKGAAGSYRNWDDRPALTLNMKKFSKKGEFHSLKKFHLNNSVQDPTYLNEFVASDLFLKAGVPAPRVTFARVWLNDRDVGFYVLKEGFDEHFLKRYFANPRGNLYEGPFCGDIDRELEKECGEGPDDRSDLKAVLDATGQSDPALRRRETEKVVDMNAFATFMAMEKITCHWDGYCQNRNNYRIYFNNGKAVFLPAGMDQMFGGPGQGIFDGAGARVAGALWSDAEFRTTYFHRAADAIRGITATESLLARIDYAHEKMRTVLAKMDQGRADQHARDVAGLKQRLIERADYLRKAVAAERANLPQEFDGNGVAVLRDWYTQSGSGAAQLSETTRDGRPALHINSNGQHCTASWRRRVLLGRGVYTISADVKSRDVVASDDQGGIGVGMSGSARPQRLAGTLGGQNASYEFTVHDDRRQVELVLELKGKSGEVWFDADSIKLTRKP